MVHIIFLLQTSHPMDQHKICFTGDMIFAKLQEIWSLNKERRETMCHWQRVPRVSDSENRGHTRRRMLADGELLRRIQVHQRAPGVTPRR